MTLIPMPSPRGTNRERLFMSVSGTGGALDAMPRRSGDVVHWADAHPARLPSDRRCRARDEVEEIGDLDELLRIVEECGPEDLHRIADLHERLAGALDRRMGRDRRRYSRDRRRGYDDEASGDPGELRLGGYQAWERRSGDFQVRQEEQPNGQGERYRGGSRPGFEPREADNRDSYEGQRGHRMAGDSAIGARPSAFLEGLTARIGVHTSGDHPASHGLPAAPPTRARPGPTRSAFTTRMLDRIRVLS